MPRVKVNKEVSIPIGQRLETLAIHHLKMTWSEFAQKLGYRNPSTLHKIRIGDSLPSAEKLHEMALLKWGRGGRINIDWLLTGNGEPLLYERNNTKARLDTLVLKGKQGQYDEVALTAALMNILKRSQNEN